MAIKEVHLRTSEKRLTGTKCPHCAKSADGSTAVDVEEAKQKWPKPGDFAVCIYCGQICCYTQGLALRKIERKERRIMERDPLLKELVALMVKASQDIRRKPQ